MNKQIEEMAHIICERDADGDICTLDSEKCDCKCTSGSIAELLYERGYRKFSDILNKMEEWHEYYEELYQTAKATIREEVVTEIISDIEQAIMAHGTNYALKRLEEIKKGYGRI